MFLSIKAVVHFSPIISLICVKDFHLSFDLKIVSISFQYTFGLKKNHTKKLYIKSEPGKTSFTFK